MRLFGQTFGARIIDRIRAELQSDGVTRSTLSRRVCDWLGWRSATGKAQEVRGRKALLALERRGLITLPAPCATPPQARKRSCSSQTPTVFHGELEALGRVELVAVDAQDRQGSARWNALMQEHHPLGEGPLCGAQRRYLVHAERVGWVGGLAFSAAAWHLCARDDWIGWCAKARRENLQKVVANSRFLILPGISVPNLASHVLGLAARRVRGDWPAHYGYTPVLLETFVDEQRFAGTCYRAANWTRVGETAGRGREHGANRREVGRKGVYVLPLSQDWRAVLCALPSASLQLPPAQESPSDWAQHELGRAPFVDGRLPARLVTLARDFYAQPLAPINQACHGDVAKTKAAYRFMKNPQVDLPTILHPHIEATAARVQEHSVVLAVQDTTSLNYTAHPATEALGPINTRQDKAKGLKLHDTMAFTTQGVPLGLLDIQCWVRDPAQAGKREQRKDLPIEEKESLRWLTSYRRVAEVQRLCPQTRLVSVADREADIYELLEEVRATQPGPDLLIRADRARQRKVQDQSLWDHLTQQSLAGEVDLHIPGKGGRKARTARIEVRHAPVEVQPPKNHPGPAISLWAVYAWEPAPPPDIEPVEWMLLTTVEVTDFEQARERLAWYAIRWSIEVYHRTLKSGCRIEDRRLGQADSLQTCLAIDLVVAWRILHLTKLGRETPEVPCTVFFREEEWQALWVHHHKTPTPPSQPPPLGVAMRLVAKLGGFLGRKSDGHPGTTVLWRGLQRLEDITETFIICRSVMPAGP